MVNPVPKYRYQIGGSLNINATSYVLREADYELYEALFQGDFCYVFNSRQMGKSSLRVRVKNRLEREGFVCVSIDMTNIGSKDITPEQWYKSLTAELWRGLNLIDRVKFKTWWAENEGISPLKKLSSFIVDVVLTEIDSSKIFIFIDEIDSVFSLDFAADDFFALIRYFYNARVDNQELNRLSFALFGVATPQELIKDHSKTPFNIGTAIELGGLKYPEVMALTGGLASVSQSETLVREILRWTEGQPFLTQKICSLARDLLEESETAVKIFPGGEASWVANLVQTRVIDNWQAQDEPVHLKTIGDRLVREETLASRLLGLYGQVLQDGFITIDGSAEQNQLLLSGAVKKLNDKLVVRNPIYQQVFNLAWVERELARLRPYSDALSSWVKSNYLDRSRLLSGQALREARAWAADKSLSDLDYRYLAASREVEQQIARQELEASKLLETEAKLAEQKENAKLEKLLMFTFGGAFIVSSLLGLIAYQQFRNAISSQNQAALNEVESRAISARALFASDQKLDALVEAIKARRKLQQLAVKDPQITNSVDVSLLQAVQGAVEYNRLSGHEAEVWQVAYSLDGNLIATSSADNTVKLWTKEGKELTTLKGHTAVVRSMTFSPKGDLIVTGSADNTVKLWNTKGQELAALRRHTAAIRSVAFSPDGKFILSGSADKTVRIWNLDGRELRTFSGNISAIRSVAWSPDGKTIAAAEEDNSIHLWSPQGEEEKHLMLMGHTSGVLSVAFSPDSKSLVSGSADNTVKLWSTQGKELRTLKGHTAKVRSVAFSPDGKTIASGSADNNIKIWSLKGELLKTLKGHSASVRSVAFSPDGESLASASSDMTVKLWKTKTLGLTPLKGHSASVRSVAFSPDGQTIATGSGDKTIKLWNTEGEVLATFKGHEAGVMGVTFSPDGQTIASSSSDNTIKLWNRAGNELKTLTGHRAAIRSVDFSPNGRFIATASADNTIRLWTRQGREIKILRGHQAGLWQALFSPNSNVLASASEDATIKLWNISQNTSSARFGEPLDSIEGHNSAVLSLSFSSDSQLIASGSRDNTVRVWSLEGVERAVMEGHEALVRSVVFSPDGKTIASAGGDRRIEIWNTEGEELTTFKGHSAAIRHLAFSPNGKLVASASEDSTAILWNLEELVDLEPLSYACKWVKDYLQYNSELTPSDRRLCAEN